MAVTSDWIEYVLRHGGAQHLRAQVFNIHWYQYYLIDVIAFLVLWLPWLSWRYGRHVDAFVACAVKGMGRNRRMSELVVQRILFSQRLWHGHLFLAKFTLHKKHFLPVENESVDLTFCSHGTILYFRPVHTELKQRDLQSWNHTIFSPCSHELKQRDLQSWSKLLGQFPLAPLPHYNVDFSRSPKSRSVHRSLACFNIVWGQGGCEKGSERRTRVAHITMEVCTVNSLLFAQKVSQSLLTRIVGF